MHDKKKQLDLIYDIAKLFLSEHEDIALSGKENEKIRERIGSETLDSEHLKQLLYMLRAKSDRKSSYYRQWAHKSDAEEFQDGQPIPLPSTKNISIPDYEPDSLYRHHEYLKKTGSRKGGKFTTVDYKAMKADFNKCRDGELTLVNAKGKPIEFGAFGFNAAMGKHFKDKHYITNLGEAKKRAKELLDMHKNKISG